MKKASAVAGLQSRGEKSCRRSCCAYAAWRKGLLLVAKARRDPRFFGQAPRSLLGSTHSRVEVASERPGRGYLAAGKSDDDLQSGVLMNIAPMREP